MRDRLFNGVMGLALIGMFALILCAGIFGGDSAVTYVVALVLIGPFLFFSVAMCVCFALSLVLYGEPDRILDRWF